MPLQRTPPRNEEPPDPPDNHIQVKNQLIDLNGSGVEHSPHTRRWASTDSRTITQEQQTALSGSGTPLMVKNGAFQRSSKIARSPTDRSRSSSVPRRSPEADARSYKRRRPDLTESNELPGVCKSEIAMERVRSAFSALDGLIRKWDNVDVHWKTAARVLEMAICEAIDGKPARGSLLEQVLLEKLAQTGVDAATCAEVGSLQLHAAENDKMEMRLSQLEQERQQWKLLIQGQEAKIRQLNLALSEAQVQPLHTNGKASLLRNAVDSSTQTLSAKELRETHVTAEVRKMLASLETGDDATAAEVMAKAWPKAAFQVAKQERRSLAKIEGSRAILVDCADPDGSKKIWAGLSAQFPALPQLLDRRPPSGAIGVLESSDSLELDGDVRSTSRRSLAVGFADRSNAISCCLGLLRRIDVMAPQGALALSAHGLLSAVDLAKAVEIAMKERRDTVAISQERSSRRWELIDQPALGDAQSVATNRPGRAPARPAASVLVRTEGQSFADIVRAMKAAIKPEESGAEVLKIIPAGTDGARVVLKNGTTSAALESLRNNMAIRLPDMAVSTAAVTDVVHVLDLDASISQDELEQLAKEELGLPIDSKDLRVTSVRPAHSGTQRATIVARKDLARKLAEKRAIKVGWTHCPVRLREQREGAATRCYRCLTQGHRAKACKGPDRSRLCYKCGDASHRATSCDKDPRCLVCNEVGHSIGGRECKAARSRRTGIPATEGLQSVNLNNNGN